MIVVAAVLVDAAPDRPTALAWWRRRRG